MVLAPRYRTTFDQDLCDQLDQLLQRQSGDFSFLKDLKSRQPLRSGPTVVSNPNTDICNRLVPRTLSFALWGSQHGWPSSGFWPTAHSLWPGPNRLPPRSQALASVLHLTSLFWLLRASEISQVGFWITDCLSRRPGLPGGVRSMQPPWRGTSLFSLVLTLHGPAYGCAIGQPHGGHLVSPFSLLCVPAVNVPEPSSGAGAATA